MGDALGDALGPVMVNGSRAYDGFACIIMLVVPGARCHGQLTNTPKARRSVG